MAWPFAGAEADRYVMAVATQVDNIDRRIERQLDVGVPLPEPAEARHQPAFGEGRGQGNAERTGRLPVCKIAYAVCNGAEAFGQRGGEETAFLGRLDDLPVAHGKGLSEFLLEIAHMLGDRRMRHVQFPRRRREASGPRSGLECAK